MHTQTPFFKVSYKTQENGKIPVLTKIFHYMRHFSKNVQFSCWSLLVIPCHQVLMFKIVSSDTSAKGQNIVCHILTLCLRSV